MILNLKNSKIQFGFQKKIIMMNMANILHIEYNIQRTPKAMKHL